MVSLAVTPKLNRTPDSGSRCTLTSTAEFDEEWSTRKDGYGFAYDRTCKSPIAVFFFDVQPKSALALTKTTSTTTPIESFTRDPIGFVDGYSVYRAYMDVDGMDPSGFDLIWSGNPEFEPGPGTFDPPPTYSPPWIGFTPGNGIPGPSHNPGGPEELPDGDNRCSGNDTCATLGQKIENFLRAIKSHTDWDRAHPDPRWPGGRHASEIQDMVNGTRRCHEMYTRNDCKKPCKEPEPVSSPVCVPIGLPICEIRTVAKPVVVCAGTAVAGYICYRVIRMVPSFFCPPTAVPNLLCW